MKQLLLTLVLLLSIGGAAFSQDVDENPMRDALDKWHEFYHTEMHKPDVEKAIGLYTDENLAQGANTRRMQLRYFDRKVCRLFAAIKDQATSDAFVKQIGDWTTKPLPTSP